MYIIRYLLTKQLVFYIKACNWLAVVFLRKQLIDMTNSSWLIGLYSDNYTEIKPLGPKKYIGFRSRQVSV